MLRISCILASLALLAVALPNACGASEPARRPNIVFLCSDDQRADTIAALDNAHIRTPNLDRLVERGTTFTNAFCMGSTVPAVCAPSRAMFLTGKPLFRAIDPKRDPQKVLPDLPTWPETMRKAGYTTCGIGKWHNPASTYVRSFSTGGPIFLGGMGNQYKIPVQDFNPEGVYDRTRQRPGNRHSSELFADAAVNFLRGEDAKTQPFMLYVTFTAPHDPRNVPPDYAALYDPAKLPLPPNFLPEHPFDNGEMEVRDEKLMPRPRTEEKIKEELAIYYAMITHLDAQIGRILTALDESGQAENTIIIFTSDHGLALGSHGLLGKQNLYDHSMRAPLIIVGKGVPEGLKTSAQCYLFDIFPTACELSGVPIPGTVEGKSLVQLLQKPHTEIRDVIFGAYREVQRSVRTPDWKLIQYPKIGREQLFNVAEDPHEMHDLAADPRNAVKLAELKEKLIAAQQESGDPMVKQVVADQN